MRMRFLIPSYKVRLQYNHIALRAFCDSVFARITRFALLRTYMIILCNSTCVKYYHASVQHNKHMHIIVIIEHMQDRNELLNARALEPQQQAIYVKLSNAFI